MTTRAYSIWMAILLATGCGAAAWAEVPEPPDPTEQQVQSGEEQAQWVQRLQQAGSLLAAGKADEALKAFQSLQADLPNLDTDGILALAIGDCQYKLGQYDQAKAAYLQAQAAHPNLAQDLQVRLIETDVAAGETSDAQTALQQVAASTDSSATKVWATMRMAMMQEQQAIQALQKAQEAYVKASQIKTEGISSGGWSSIHAEDLKDAVQQLQTALRPLDRNLRRLTLWRMDEKEGDIPPGPDIAKASLSGTIYRTADKKDPVELTVGKDGKVEVTLAGKKMMIDAATQRQINRHVQQALRLAGQEEKTDAVTK